MKLMVNYDLLSKIATSKNGLMIDRTAKKVITNPLIVQGVCLPVQLLANFTKEQILNTLLHLIIFQILISGISDIILSKVQKEVAILQLKLLSHTLKNLDINTDYDLLVQSYKYKTNYKLEYNESKLPKIKQEKYIMLPVYEAGEEKEVSILQEHIIGTSKYELSIGEPQVQKKLKLAKNTI